MCFCDVYIGSTRLINYELLSENKVINDRRSLCRVRMKITFIHWILLFITKNYKWKLILSWNYLTNYGSLLYGRIFGTLLDLQKFTWEEVENIDLNNIWIIIIIFILLQFIVNHKLAMVYLFYYIIMSQMEWNGKWKRQWILHKNLPILWHGINGILSSNYCSDHQVHHLGNKFVMKWQALQTEYKMKEMKIQNTWVGINVMQLTLLAKSNAFHHKLMWILCLCEIGWNWFYCHGRDGNSRKICEFFSQHHNTTTFHQNFINFINWSVFILPFWQLTVTILIL